MKRKIVLVAEKCEVVMEMIKNTRFYQNSPIRSYVVVIIFVFIIGILFNSSVDLVGFGKLPLWNTNFPNKQEAAIFPINYLTFFQVASPPSERATLISPIGTITSASPTYNWTSVENASHYLLVVKKNGTDVVTWFWNASTEVCSTGACSVTPGKLLGAGEYTWWVLGQNEGGNSPWSLPGTFTIEGKPDRPDLYFPELTITDQTPNYTWEDVYSAQQYLLVVKKNGTEVVTWLWGNQSDICTSGICELDPGKKLGAGAYTFWVVAQNGYGFGFWSRPGDFIIEGTPDQPDLYSPMGAVNDSSPQFQWEAVYSADQYLFVLKDTLDSVQVWQWFNSTDICTDGLCSVIPVGVELASDNYDWLVLPKNSHGNGFWSQKSNFTVFPSKEGYEFTLFAEGFNFPLFFTQDGENLGYYYVVEKAGIIKLIDNGEIQAEPFLDISNLVNSETGERGLLGLAFHPDLSSNGFFYVSYTDLNGDSVIGRFEVSTDPTLADENSLTILLSIPQPYANHNGGMLAFGPDGYLYIGVGDGGSGGDPHENGQNVNVLLGKILRIDVDSAEPYGIPGGNISEGLDEIWAYGLRNPWRFSFDTLTGNLFIGDVGQNLWEEISFLPAGTSGGVNLGWNYFEGTHPFSGTPPAGESFVFPIVEYTHTSGNCSVTGGYVYRGSLLAWNGIYIFGDFCTGTIWSALQDSSGDWHFGELFQLNKNITSFGQDLSGEVYAVTIDGMVYKFGLSVP